MASGWIGFTHTALLDYDGAVWTAGCGAGGQLGHGTWTNSPTLQRVEGLPPCSVVSSGDQFTMCVSVEGQVYCFGGNKFGQLGQGYRNVRNLNTPRQVIGLPLIQSVQCGPDFVILIDEDLCLWSLGHNHMGQLGLNHTNDVHTPCRVDDVTARQVACGGYHTMAVTPDDQLYAWGGGARGQLGNKCQATSLTSPTHIPVPFEPDSVHCGAEFSVVRAKDGTLWSTGSYTTEETRFTQIAGLCSTQVACEWYFVMSIDEKSRLWTWGQGQPTPTIVREDAVRVLTGPAQTLVLTTNGQVLARGSNTHSQLALCTDEPNPRWIDSTITPTMMRVDNRSVSRAKSARK